MIVAHIQITRRIIFLQCRFAIPLDLIAFKQNNVSQLFDLEFDVQASILECSVMYIYNVDANFASALIHKTEVEHINIHSIFRVHKISITTYIYIEQFVSVEKSR